MPENRNIEVRSEAVQEVLEAVPSWMIRWGNSLLLVLLMFLLSISWFIKYPDAIPTSIVLTTVIPPEKLYANSTGKLDALLIKNGDHIQKGQALAVIENPALHQDVFLLKKVLDTLQVDRINFFFPMDELPPLVLGDMNFAFATFENNYSAYVLDKTLQLYQSESVANEFSLSEAKTRLELLLEQRELGQKELQLKEIDLIRQKDLYKQGIVSPKEYGQRQIEFLQTQKADKGLESSISQIKELIANAQRTLQRSAIENTQKKSQLLKNTLQSFYQLQKEIRDWEQQYLLKASMDGQISFLEFRNENQNVRTGDLIFMIVPMNDIAYIGKIVAPQASSGKIKIGQNVQVQLANYPSSEYGELNGEIRSISPVPNVEGNYLIEVAFPQELITTYHKSIVFKQEMQGIANIITEDLRLMERFFYQLKNIMD